MSLSGKRVAGYQLDSPIGSGPTGTVYRAHDGEGGCFAVKVVSKELSLPRRVDRLLADLSAIADLGHHGIVEICGNGWTDDGRFFYVMEELSGSDLAEVLARGPLEPVDALPLLKEVCLSVEAAHAVGIAHGAIKPRNIFLVSQEGAPRPAVRLLDFGVFRLAQDEQGDAKGIAGKLAAEASYLAPEQLLGVCDPRSDVRAVGVLVYEMLCGQNPFAADGIADDDTSQTLARVRAPVFPAGMSEEVARIIRKALATAPDERYQTVRDLWLDLSTWAAAHSMRHPGKKPRSGEARSGRGDGNRSAKDGPMANSKAGKAKEPAGTRGAGNSPAVEPEGSGSAWASTSSDSEVTQRTRMPPEFVEAEAPTASSEPEATGGQARDGGDVVTPAVDIGSAESVRDEPRPATAGQPTMQLSSRGADRVVVKADRVVVRADSTSPSPSPATSRPPDEPEKSVEDSLADFVQQANASLAEEFKDLDLAAEVEQARGQGSGVSAAVAPAAPAAEVQATDAAASAARSGQAAPVGGVALSSGRMVAIIVGAVVLGALAVVVAMKLLSPSTPEDSGTPAGHAGAPATATSRPAVPVALPSPVPAAVPSTVSAHAAAAAPQPVATPVAGPAAAPLAAPVATGAPSAAPAISGAEVPPTSGGEPPPRMPLQSPRAAGASRVKAALSTAARQVARPARPGPKAAPKPKPAKTAASKAGSKVKSGEWVDPGF